MKISISIIISAILIFSIFSASFIASTLAQEEMTPNWKYTNGGDFSKIGISGDGNYIGAGTYDTHRFYLFHGNTSLWSSLLSGPVQSISMSSDGGYAAVGTVNYGGSDFYIFNRNSADPILKYYSEAGGSEGVISSDGKHALVAFSPGVGVLAGLRSEVMLFEIGKSEPSWTTYLTGSVYSLSMSQDGEYFVITAGNYQANVTGTIYLFDREQQTPLWTYTIGEYGANAVITGDGNYVIAVGGAQEDGSDYAIYQFSSQSSDPLWQAPLVTTNPLCTWGLSTSYNGSVSAVGLDQGAEGKIVLFDKNIAHELPIEGSGYQMTMSMDGRYIFVNNAHLLSCEYSAGTLDLKQEYQPTQHQVVEWFTNIASSADGKYVTAAVDIGADQNGVFFFSRMTETSGPNNQYGLILIVAVVLAVVLVLGVALFSLKRILHRKPIG